MKKTNTCIIGKKLAEIELDDPIPGRQDWWRRLRTLMLLRKDSGLVLKPDIPKGLGGFETSKDSCNFVVMRPNILKNGKLTFRKAVDFAIFVHEMSHFWHFHWKGGRLDADTIEKGKIVPSIETQEGKDYYESPRGRFHVELEAWDLSRKFNEQFDMNLQLEIEYANRMNMFSVCIMTGILGQEYRRRRTKIVNTNVFGNWRLDENDKLTDKFILK